MASICSGRRPGRANEIRRLIMTFQALLITGGAGFIGANFVRHWRGEQPDGVVVVLDALTYAGNVASLAEALGTPGFHFVQGDIGDTTLVEELLRRHQIDAIVHFAAESHVDRSISGPDAFIETNILGTYGLLKAARRVWLEQKAVPGPVRFLHVSTDEVYGSLGSDDPAFHEDTRYAPNSPYSASKAASDHLVRAYQHTYGLPTVTTNCSNNYGPYQHPEKLLPLMLINALEGRPLPVYGDGANVRDWLHVGDHCRGIALALTSGADGACYNIGGENEQRNIDLVHLLCAEVDRRFAADPTLAVRFPDAPQARGGSCRDLIAYVEDRPGHDRRYAIDARRIARELGFAPAETMTSGLARTIDWYLANEAWWRGVMDGSYRDWMKQNYGTRASA
jgi:dTDP-glucose 4,6-dehydratase